VQWLGLYINKLFSVILELSVTSQSLALVLTTKPVQMTGKTCQKQNTETKAALMKNKNAL